MKTITTKKKIKTVTTTTKPSRLYRGAVSGLWYKNPKSAGRIDAVQLMGERIFRESGERSYRWEARIVEWADEVCWHHESDNLEDIYATVPKWAAEEIRATWRTAAVANGQLEAFRILERMVDRLGYGRTENNPSLAKENKS